MCELPKKNGSNIKMSALRNILQNPSIQFKVYVNQSNLYSTNNPYQITFKYKRNIQISKLPGPISRYNRGSCC